MKKGKLRRFTAFLLAFAMIMTLMPTNVFAAGNRSDDKSTVTASEDGITVTKHAEYAKNKDGSIKKDSNGNPYVNIKFDVEAAAETQGSGSTDIVLVIDNSLSMTWSKSQYNNHNNQYNPQKLNNAKTAAVNFVEQVLNITGATVNVGVVTFSKSVVNKCNLTNNVSNLTTAINSINTEEYTFIQKGIHYGQQMLQGGNGTNKIMIVLGDGLPTYRYNFNKKQGTNQDDDSKRTIKSSLAFDNEYEAYTNFDYSSINHFDEDGGLTDYDWNDSLPQEIKKGYEATISQAYIARENIPNLNIYTIGYDIGSGKSAEHIFKYIADKDKYSHAQGVNYISEVVQKITNSVTESVKGATLTDQIPSEMTLVEGSASTHSDITFSETSEGVLLKWKDKLVPGRKYTTTFQTILDLSKLGQEQRALLHADGQYINTNGVNVVANGIGPNSSVFTYGVNKNIKLDSPQLPLQSILYDIQYYYDKDGNNTYDETEKENVQGKTVNSKYVFAGTPEATFNVQEAAKDGYVLDKVLFGTENGTTGPLTISQDTYIKLQYCKDDKKSIVITKEWEDNNDQDGIRPESVGFKVTKVVEGKEVIVETGTLTAKNNWTTTISGLNTVETYTVAETTAIEGYEKTEVDMSDTPNITADGEREYACTITNTHTPETTSVNALVTWDDADDQDGKRPEDVTITLYKQVGDSDEEKTEKSQVVKLSDEWQCVFSDLPKYENGKKITYIAKQSSVDEYTTTEVSQDKTDNSFEFKNVYTPMKTNFIVNKRWLDGEDADGKRPTSIKVQLYNNGEAEGNPITLTSPGWTHKWTGLDMYSSGDEIVYTVAEVVDNTDTNASLYTPSITYNGNTATITNKYNKKTSITVVKSWDDDNNRDCKRPTSVTIELLNGNTVVGSASVTENDKWQYTFNNLAEYDDNGKKITYTVSESNKPAGYTSRVEGYTITNTYVPEKVSKTVEKVWEGDNHVSQFVRPSKVILVLRANGTEVGRQEVNSACGWKATFNNLPKYYNNNGQKAEIVYSVKEEYPQGQIEKFENYEEPKYNGLTVTNVYKPVKITKTVTKVWDDALGNIDNYDRKRPESITVNLIGKVGNTEVVNESGVITETANGWQYIFTNLDKYYTDGNEIVYTVVEEDVPEYTMSNMVTQGDVITITNSHEILKKDVKVVKTWDDDNNRDGKRPTSITVQLYKNGSSVGEPVVLDASNNWTKVWEDQLVYGVLNDDTGVFEMNTYSVEEVSMPAGYTKTVHTTTGNGKEDEDVEVAITNTHTSEKTSLTVNKVWDDNDNQDGYRQDSVTVQLYANNDEYGDPVVLDESNSWTNTWSDLYVYAGGNEINYTVEEVDVPDNYSAEVSTPQKIEGNLTTTITNTHVPETTTYTVRKVWVDEFNNDTNKPTYVDVCLYAGTQIIDTVRLTAKDNWTKTWTNLPAKADGMPIVYSVDEPSVPVGYVKTIDSTSSVNTTVITNTYNVDKTSFTVVKEWNDNNNNDNIRPGSVEVQLLADGNVVSNSKQVLNSGNNWTYTWDNLNAMKNGSSVVYSVEEVNVPQGYTPSVSSLDNNVVGQKITNTHTNDKIKLTLVKKWQGGSSLTIPSSIKVNVYANGNKYKTVTLKKSEKWTKTIEVDKNVNGENIVYTIDEATKTSGYTLQEDNASIAGKDGTLTITNVYNVKTADFTIIKEWDDANDQDNLRPNLTGILVNVYRDGKFYSLVSLNVLNKWKATLKGLEVERDGKGFTYSVEETIVPVGYTSSAKEPVEFNKNNSVTITNTHKPLTTTFKVAKIWNDDNNNDGLRPESITVNLYANGKVIEGKTLTLSEANNWKAQWDNLPLFTNKVPNVYTVKEEVVGNGYVSTVRYGVDREGAIAYVTNTRENAKVSFTAQKEWNDNNNQDGIRPDSVEVRLLADGVAVANSTQTLSEDNNWTYTWTNLNGLKNGNAIEYSVEEVSIPTGYTANIENIDNGQKIVNTHEIMTTTVQVEKIWQDNDNNDGVRPESIDVVLLANGNAADVETLTLSEENNWKAEWSGLALRQNGNNITYTVEEINVENGYVSNVRYADVNEGKIAIITNARDDAKTSFTVNKVWNDSNNADRLRPTSIDVQLHANVDGEEIEIANSTQTLSEDNNWTYTWTNLNSLKNGKTIEYSVEEIEVPSGYTAKVENTVNGQTITNTHIVIPVVPKKSVSVLFDWDDLEDIEGVRPSDMLVKLYADGDFTTKTMTVNKDTWKVTFDNLPIYENGKKINYTIQQAYVPNAGTDTEYTYVGTVTDSSKADFVITNKYRATIDKDITIIWDDEENIDGTRPEEVIVQPTVDGENYGDPIKITIEDVKEDDNNTWKGNTSELPKYTEDGEEIEYRVVQSEVDKYTTSYSDDSFTITNKYTRLPLTPNEEDDVIEEEKDQDSEEVVEEDKNFAPKKDADVIKKDKTTKYKKTPGTNDVYDMSKYLWMLVLSAMGLLALFADKKRRA